MIKPAFLMGALLLGACATPMKRSSEVTASLCELAAGPDRYVSEKVVTSGRVSGGPHGVWLLDSSCPEGNLAVEIDNRVAKQPDVAPFWDAIYRRGMPGTLGKSITATLRGGYELDEGERRRGRLILLNVVEFTSSAE